MTIEVRQIQIKASVTKRLDGDEGAVNLKQAYEILREKIMDDCRLLINEILAEERER